MSDVEVLEDTNSRKITYARIRKAMKGKNFPMSLVGEEVKAVTLAVNMGIDSRLQACFVEGKDSYKHGERSIIAPSDGKHWKKGDKLVLARTLECSVSPESLPVLLRRLFEDLPGAGEDGSLADVGQSLAQSILDSVLGEPE